MQIISEAAVYRDVLTFEHDKAKRGGSKHSKFNTNFGLSQVYFFPLLCHLGKRQSGQSEQSRSITTKKEKRVPALLLPGRGLARWDLGDLI